MKVISWNLFRLAGATVSDVAALIEQYHPDLLLMQEVTEQVAALTEVVGGHFFRERLHGRIYGLAAWSRCPLPPPYALLLPASRMPGRVPPRVAQIIRFGEVTFANVHLSHGQLLNRWQLVRVARSLQGPAAVVGDYNAIGPIKLSGFADVGPRKRTHLARNIIPFRLDRCMVRGLHCADARVLDRGPSDHHPIILDLNVASNAAFVSKRGTVRNAAISSVMPYARRREASFDGFPVRVDLGTRIREMAEGLWVRCVDLHRQMVALMKSFIERLRAAGRVPGSGVDTVGK